MRTKILLITMLAGIFAIGLSCSDPESCADNPQLCIATCITDPQLCIDEDGTLGGVPTDSIQVVSKLPIRE